MYKDEFVRQRIARRVKLVKVKCVGPVMTYYAVIRPELTSALMLTFFELKIGTPVTPAQ